jgi:hypothetical protein
MFGSASDDELADVCDNIELKAKLGVGANETLMLVVYLEEDGDPEDVAMVIANRLKKPVVVLHLDASGTDGEVLAFARPRSTRARPSW